MAYKGEPSKFDKTLNLCIEFQKVPIILFFVSIQRMDCTPEFNLFSVQ